MERDLVDQIKIDSVVQHTTAAASDITNATPLDMQGYQGVIFIARFGTAAANNTIQAQQGLVSDGSDAADIKDSKVAVGASDEIVVLQLESVGERYIRPVVKRGTSSTLEFLIAIRYGPLTKPVANAVAGTLALRKLFGTAEGTP
jgi:hypothetical protein